MIWFDDVREEWKLRVACRKCVATRVFDVLQEVGGCADASQMQMRVGVLMRQMKSFYKQAEVCDIVFGKLALTWRDYCYWQVRGKMST